MRLNNELSRRITPELILRINELYHDFERESYDTRHGNWHQAESTHYRSLAGKYMSHDAPICCLDFGTGTGFVPLAVGSYLKSSDELICVDISEQILNECRTKLGEAGFSFSVRYLKTDGYRIPVEDKSVDVLTMNSVLHHLHDLYSFASECKRVVKDQGLLIVAHEPNGERNLPILGKIVYTVTRVLFKPSLLVFNLVYKSPWIEKVLRDILSNLSPAYAQRNKMLQDIAVRLQKEKLIDRELRGVEIQQLVDYHSQRGFTKQYLLDVFNGFNVLEWHTYHYLGDLVEKNVIARYVAKSIEEMWPQSGASLAFVFQKK